MAHRKEKKRLQNKVSRVVAEKEKPVSLDAFGFPELKAPFPKVQSIQTRLQISESLESHRKCDKACIQLAQSLVKNELPVWADRSYDNMFLRKLWIGEEK